VDESRYGIITTAARLTSNKGIDMAELSLGDLAPAFTLPRDGGGSIALSDFAGKPVVLYFYPRDDTSGCTSEAIDFSRLKPDFDKAGAVVIGVSPDSAAKHDKFKAKHSLTVELAADEERKAIEAYGVWVEKSLYGRRYMGVERATFLIGPDGRIAALWRKVRVKGHAQAVLETVRQL
jgi:peroxiredoxin Q/BCP